MTVRLSRVAVAASVLLLAACASAPVGTKAAASNCTSHTAWAGSETAAQHGTATLFRIPTAEPITLTHLTVSISYTQLSGAAAGFSEVLALVGVSDVPLTLGPYLMPVTTPAGSFQPVRVDTTAPGHNENPTFNDGVVAARILKSYNGAASELVNLDMNRAVPANGVVWVRYDSVSTQTLDPEVQLVATYTRCDVP